MKKFILWFLLFFILACFQNPSILSSSRNLYIFDGTVDFKPITMYLYIDSEFQKFSGKFYYHDNKNQYYYISRGFIDERSQMKSQIFSNFYSEKLINMNLDYINEDSLGELIGQLTSQLEFTGFWNMGSNTYSIKLNPRNHKLSLNILNYSLNEELSSNSAQYSPSFEYEYEILSISNAKIYPKIHVINQYYQKNLHQSLKKMQEDRYSWKKNIKKYTNSISGSMISSSSTMDIIYLDHKILSIKNISYSFSGGAHGSTIHQALVFDLDNGKVINNKVDEFIISLEDPLLLNLLRIKLINHMRNIQFSNDEFLSDENLKDMYMNFDTIRFNDFYEVNSKGISFIYNQYEIAPYSYGVIEIFFTFEELKPFINNNSTIRYLFE